MKKTVLLFVGVILLLSCEQQNKADKNAAKFNIYTAKEKTFTITDLDEEDFKVIEGNDTIYYLKQLQDGLEGKKIQLDLSTVSDLTAKIKFDFSFLQYTTDYNPALPLEYTRQSRWSDLQIKEGVIEIPDFNENSDNRKVYEVLGFESRQELLEWIVGEYFEEIKKESIQAQTHFYQALLQDKSRYESCCPEYIQQAKAFLSSQSKNKRNINELGLELTYETLTIGIVGQLNNGEKYHRVIVEK